MLGEMEEALAAAPVPMWLTLRDHFGDKLVENARLLIDTVAKEIGS